MMIYKGLDEKDMTKIEAYPLWIWGVIRKVFFSTTLRRFAMGHSRFYEYSWWLHVRV